jgi:4-hydroxy-tetrahydrodipicolinate synthase
MVGTAALTTAECIRLTQHAESVGADAVAINPVSYWPLTAEEVFQHFEQIANAVNISICVYNNPRTTQFDILPELAGRLSALPHIDNIKEISTDLGRIAQLKQSSGGKLSVSNGRDAQGCEAFIAGADGWQSGIAGVIPEPCVQIFNLVKKDKNFEAARKVAAEFADLCRFFSEKGLIRSEHTALEMMGMSVGKPRPPVRVLESADAEKLKQYLTTFGVLGQGVGAGTGRR